MTLPKLRPTPPIYRLMYHRVVDPYTTQVSVECIDRYMGYLSGLNIGTSTITAHQTINRPTLTLR